MIPTKQYIFMIELINLPPCSFCKADNKTTDHFLNECYFVVVVVSFNCNLHAKQIIKENIVKEKNVKFDNCRFLDYEGQLQTLREKL